MSIGRKNSDNKAERKKSIKERGLMAKREYKDTRRIPAIETISPEERRIASETVGKAKFSQVETQWTKILTRRKSDGNSSRSTTF